MSLHYHHYMMIGDIVGTLLSPPLPFYSIIITIDHGIISAIGLYCYYCRYPSWTASSIVAESNTTVTIATLSNSVSPQLPDGPTPQDDLVSEVGGGGGPRAAGGGGVGV
jgi:hypothetical protein